MFKGELVRAILEDRKNQTRRVVKPQPPAAIGIEKVVLVDDPWHNDAFVGTPAEGMGRTGEREKVWYAEDFCGNLVLGFPRCPFGAVGDRLWVRETWMLDGADVLAGEKRVLYRAEEVDRRRVEGMFKWKPSIFMPRCASRITLEIVDVRVERLQDISREDALAEGVEDGFAGQYFPGYLDMSAPVANFRRLWDSINAAKPGCSWSDSPWAWVIEFRRVKP